MLLFYLAYHEIGQLWSILGATFGQSFLTCLIQVICKNLKIGKLDLHFIGWASSSLIFLHYSWTVNLKDSNWNDFLNFIFSYLTLWYGFKYCSALLPCGINVFQDRMSHSIVLHSKSSPIWKMSSWYCNMGQAVVWYA